MNPRGGGSGGSGPTRSICMTSNLASGRGKKESEVVEYLLILACRLRR